MAQQSPDVRVRLSAEGQQEVIAAFRRVEREGTRSGRSVENTFKSLGRLLPAISFTAVTAGLIALAKNTLGAIDNLSKLSEKTGIATETLTAYAHGANLAGVDTETLAKGLGKLARTASDAANGVKTAQRPFQQLGVNVQENDGRLRSLDDLLGDVAEKFSGMEDGTRKAALAQELFGRGGVALIPFLNKGRAGLAAMRAEAERLGLIIGSDAAKSVEEFNDNLTRLQSRLTGFAIQVINQNIPGLLAMSEALLQLAGDAEKAGDDVTSGLFNKFVLFGFGMDAVLKNVVDVARIRFQQLAALAAGRPFEATALEALRAAIPDVSTAFNEGMLEGIRLLESLRDAAKKAAGTPESEEGIHGIATAAKKAKSELEKVNILLGEQQITRPTLLRPGERIVTPEEREATFQTTGPPITTELVDLRDEARRVFEETRNAGEIAIAKIARLRELFAAGAIDAETFERAVGEIKDELKGAATQVETLGQNIQQSLQVNFTNFFTSGIQNAESFQDAMANLALSVVQSLQAIAAEFLATILVQKLFGLFTGNPAQQIATAAAAGTAQATPLIAASAALDTSGAALLAAGGTLTIGAAALTGAAAPLTVAGGIIITGAVALTIAAAALEAAAITLLIANSAGGGGFGLAGGGLVLGPGSGTSDSIPAWLSRGEVVIREAVASQPGVTDLLLTLNRYGPGALRLAEPRGFAEGGMADALSGLDFAGGRGGDGANGSLDLHLGLDTGLLLDRIEANSKFDRVILRVTERNRKAINAVLGHNAI